MKRFIAVAITMLFALCLAQAQTDPPQRGNRGRGAEQQPQTMTPTASGQTGQQRPTLPPVTPDPAPIKMGAPGEAPVVRTEFPQENLPPSRQHEQSPARQIEFLTILGAGGELKIRSRNNLDEKFRRRVDHAGGIGTRLFVRSRHQADDLLRNTGRDEMATWFRDDLDSLNRRHREQPQPARCGHVQLLAKVVEIRKEILAECKHDAIRRPVDVVLSGQRWIGTKALV